MDTQDNEIQDLGSLHHYRTELPNIIFQMKLEPLALAVYCVLKMTAGDKGSCFKKNITLAEEIGCSVPTLIRLKHVLEEKGLIKIIKRKHESGSLLPDLIRIVDIWPENMRKLSERKPNSNFKRDGKAFLVGVVKDFNQGTKGDLEKQEHIEEKKEQQQAAAPAAAVFSASKKEMKQEPVIFDCLKEVDIPQRDKVEISTRYDAETVRNAIGWATHKDNPPNKSLAASIKYACKSGLSIKDLDQKKETAYQKIKRFFEHGEYYKDNRGNNVECFLNEECVAFQRGMKHQQMKLDKFFSWREFINMCNDFSIKIPNPA